MTELEQSLERLEWWSRSLTLALMDGPAGDAEQTDVIVDSLVQRCKRLGATRGQLDGVMSAGVGAARA